MPALVLTPKETTSHLLQQMHDPKLSGFSRIPLPAAALPHTMDTSSSSFHHRADQAAATAAAILDKNNVIGLHNHHHHHHHLHSLQQQQQQHHHHHHHPHQQHPYYGRSLSHPLANVPPPPPPPPPPHHFSSSSSASRVPPLHAPFTLEDVLHDAPNRGRSSFISMLSALKAEGYGRNLVEYFRPSIAARMSSGAITAGHFDSNLDVLSSYHSDGLHASVLSSSLPTQISTLYHRMISQSRAQDNRITTELARLSSCVNPDSVRIRPLSPSHTIEPTPLALSRGGKMTSVFSQDPSSSPPSSSKTSSPPHPSQSDNKCGRSSRYKDGLPLSMSPLRLSETSTSSLPLSPSSPSLSLSPSSLSSSHSNSNPHPRCSSSPDDDNNNIKKPSTSSLVPFSSSSRPAERPPPPPPSSRSMIMDAASAAHASSSSSSSSRSSANTPPERPIVPLLPSIIHSPAWQMTLSSKDVFSVTPTAATVVPTQPMLVANLPPSMLNPDAISNPLLVNRLKECASSWYLHHHHQQQQQQQHHSNHYHHHQQRHHHHRQHCNPVLDGNSNAKEALLRSSSPEDYPNLHRSSPTGKELPTKLSKQTRLRDRQEVASALGDADRERSDRLSAIKKTTSTQTQTQFPSFPHPESLVVPPPPPYFTTHDTILRDAAATASIASIANGAPHPHSHHHQQQQQHNRYHGYNGNHHTLPPPPPPHQLLPPPPPFTQSLLSTQSSLSESSSLATTSSHPSPSSLLLSSSSSSSISSSSYSNLTNTASRLSLFPSTTTNKYSQSTPLSPPPSINSSPSPNTTALTTKQSLPPYEIIPTTAPSTTLPRQPPPPLPSSCLSSRKASNLPHLKIYSQTGTTPPPPPPPHPHPPPQYKDLTLTRSRIPGIPDGVQDTPLNLSISSEGTIVVSAPSSSAPSSLAKSSSVRCNSPSQKIITKHKNSWIQRNGNLQETDPEDDAIEEHFRRSLGQKYVESSTSSSISISTSTSPSRPKNTVDASSMTSMTSVTPMTLTSSPPSYDKTVTATAHAVAMETEAIHITGSVDDHFARALGDQMWTAIKARSEPVTPEDDPDTVDAHFAKALGASMWKKLQKTDAMDIADHPSPPPSSSTSTSLDHGVKHNGHPHQHPHHPQQQQQQQQQRGGDSLYPHHQSPKHSPPSTSPNRPQLAM